jgi:hypothetical protein
MTFTMEMHDQLETAPIPDLRQMWPEDENWQRVVGEQERLRDLEKRLPRDFGPCPDWCPANYATLNGEDEVHQDLPVRERIHERNCALFTVCRCDRLDLDGHLTKMTPLRGPYPLGRGGSALSISVSLS